VLHRKRAQKEDKAGSLAAAGRCPVAVSGNFFQRPSSGCNLCGLARIAPRSSSPSMRNGTGRTGRCHAARAQSRVWSLSSGYKQFAGCARAKTAASARRCCIAQNSLSRFCNIRGCYAPPSHSRQLSVPVGRSEPFICAIVLIREQLLVGFSLTHFSLNSLNLFLMNRRSFLLSPLIFPCLSKRRRRG
jgi:hypothetical protein